ncbi:hypothetical protein CDAR_199611 [Caerostris darwini]|uniref:Uncharacterized protein n=1 Tax=Caerostris darwini TaxID=1538125 RepID=A0AAV4M8R2_9ARAC|nr:hypothetical protein CDAR_199611 [Caerostris darwini]
MELTEFRIPIKGEYPILNGRANDILHTIRQKVDRNDVDQLDSSLRRDIYIPLAPIENAFSDFASGFDSGPDIITTLLVKLIELHGISVNYSTALITELPGGVVNLTEDLVGEVEQGVEGLVSDDHDKGGQFTSPRDGSVSQLKISVTKYAFEFLVGLSAIDYCMRSGIIQHTATFEMESTVGTALNGVQNAVSMVVGGLGKGVSSIVDGVGNAVNDIIGAL